MVRYSFLAVLLSLIVASPMMGQTCAPNGWQIVSPAPYYDHIANGLPTSTACWTTNTDLVTDTLCGYSSKAFDFTYSDSLSQTFTVPSNMTQTNWELSYLLTFKDPHDDGWWHQLNARVFDVTTGQTIASHTYFGDDPDRNCGLRVLLFTGNYAGHTLRVTFKGGRLENDTVIRVRDIMLAQH